MKRFIALLLLIHTATQATCLLSDPILQDPHNESVAVVLFTDFEGANHVVEYGETLQYRIQAQTQKEITVFTVFNSGSGAVDSYYFDTNPPESKEEHFDRFAFTPYVRAPSITVLQEQALKEKLPDLVIVDVDNTLIESTRQIGLDPSVNGFLRDRFGEKAEEVIQKIQAQVPWKACEDKTKDIVAFFQSKNIPVIGVTKRTAAHTECLSNQLLNNDIDLSSALFRHSTSFKEGIFYKGVLHASGSKGAALKAFLNHAGWDWKGKRIYALDDRRSHLEDLYEQFSSECTLIPFEYIHPQTVDKVVLEGQLADFLKKENIQEDEHYMHTTVKN